MIAMQKIFQKSNFLLDYIDLNCHFLSFWGMTTSDATDEEGKYSRGEDVILFVSSGRVDLFASIIIIWVTSGYHATLTGHIFKFIFPGNLL